jgi:transposase-like protein
MFSVAPFKSLMQLAKAFPDDQSCIDHLEWLRWQGNVVSPFNSNSKVYKCKNNRYKCSATNKYFNVLTGTIFENTKIKLQHWFLAIYLFTVHKKGISSYQLAEELAITQKTAWFMLQRIRYAMEHENFIKEMEGVVEVDETFVGGKNKNRHWDKKVKNSQGRSFKDKTPVLGMLNRDSHVQCVVIPDTKTESIQPIIRDRVKPGSVIISDEWNAYRGLASDYGHMVVDHGRGQYVNALGATTNTIEGFWSGFKKGLIGIYHNVVSRKHLQRYANEFSFRYNTRKYDTQERFYLLLQGTNNKRLTYKALTAHV